MTQSLSTLQSKRHFQRAALHAGHWCAGSVASGLVPDGKVSTRGIDVGTEPLYAKVVDQRQRKPTSAQTRMRTAHSSRAFLPCLDQILEECRIPRLLFCGS